MKVIFEIRTFGEMQTEDGKPIKSRNEFDLELSDPVAEFHKVFEEMPLPVRRIIVSEETAHKIAASPSFRKYVSQVLELPEPSTFVGVVQTTIACGFEGKLGPIPGLPPIEIEAI